MENYLSKSLEEYDVELHSLIKKEKKRQINGLELIASENFTSTAVQDCLGSCLTNKYSEGTVGNRYYGGNEHIDSIESLCKKRALDAFKLNPDEWGINVQPYSGSPANFAVYTALVEPHGRIMGLDLPDGGHLTHGFYTANRKVSATSIFFESMPYKINLETQLIDYDQLEVTAKLFKPKLIVAGISCYPRNLDYEKFRLICDSNGSILMADMAHVSGLVAAGIVPNPFKCCDIVTTTTHKTLRGPRSGIIFYRKGRRTNEVTGKEVIFDYEEKLNQAVFPGLQGGPHNHQIAGVAVALKQVMEPAFLDYQRQVVANAKYLAEAMGDYLKVVTGGTDNHIVWLDMRCLKLTGSKAELILEQVSIACNKNTVPGDKSALNPSGIRLGTAALTSRGFKEDDISKVSELIIEALNLACEIQRESGPKLVDFKRFMMGKYQNQIQQVKEKVEKLAAKFPMPGQQDL